MNSSIDLSDVIPFGATNGVSVLVCLLAAILVFGLKLYKKVVYRLALYQVLSGLALSVVDLFGLLDFFDYYVDPVSYGKFCVAIGFFDVYSRWMKLLFTMWVTFHLFCFAVLNKNLKKLEVLYVVTSLLVPAVIASVPLATQAYGSAGVCYILGPANDSGHVGFIEQVALWSAPAMIMLLAASVAMVFVAIKLACKVCLIKSYEPITDGDQFTKALKQLLPLVAFPVLFFMLMIPVLTNDIYDAINPDNTTLDAVALVCIPLWSVASGVVLIVHISLARYFSKKKRKHASRFHLRNTTEIIAIKESSAVDSNALFGNSATRFSLPPASV